MIPKRNIISDQLVSFVDPSDNRGYPRGTLVIDLASSMSKNAVLVKTVSPYGYDLPDISSPLNCTIADGQTDPFIGNDAYQLTENTSVSVSHVVGQSIATASNGQYADAGFTDKAIYTHSIYAKANGSRNIMLQSYNMASANNNMTFNFATQAITHTSANVVDSGYEAIGGGWYRIWYTLKYLGTVSSTNIATARLTIYITSSTGATTYTGNGSSGLYFYGHQWQNGPLTNYVATLNNTWGSIVDSTRQNVFQTKAMRPDGSGGNPTGPASISYSSEAGGCINYEDLDANGSRQALLSAYSHLNWGDFNYNLGFTAFAWVKLSALAAPLDSTGAAGYNYCVITGRLGGKTSNNSFMLKKDGTALYFNGRWRNSLNSPNSVNVSSDAFSSIVGSWACIAMTVSAGSAIAKPVLTFYVNGVQVGASKQPAGANTGFSNGIDTSSTSGLYLGWDLSGPPFNAQWGKFTGKMGITAVYTKVLTAAEILYNYEATSYRYV